MKLTGKITEQGFKRFSNNLFLRAGRKAPRIWVVVADKGIARIFRKDSGHLEVIGEARPDETMQAELTNKAIGRVVSSGGARYHKYEPHMEQSRQDEFAFAYDLAKWLERAEAADAFDRLVLAAAPKMLGDLRAAMSATVQGRIAAEIGKDLTKLDGLALRDALDEIIWF